ncbi:MAG: hypothetical protein V3W41_05325 [Planctomycetota bacterium]
MGEALATLSATILSQAAWEQLEANCERLGGPHSRIRRRADGKLIKIFPRRNDSMAKVAAQAQDFVRNSARLRALGFSCPVVDELIHVDESFAFVVYTPIPGDSFREWVEREGSAELDRLPQYFANLHCVGVYFRGGHLGNLVRESGSGIGLIDFSDVRFAGGSLGPWKRARNLAHLLGHRLDGETIKRYGYRRFIDAYAEIAGIRGFARRRMAWFLRRRVGKY